MDVLISRYTVYVQMNSLTFFFSFPKINSVLVEGDRFNCGRFKP